MPYEYALDATAEISIGTRTIPLKGRLPDSSSSTFELSYHATSLDDSVDLGSLTTALNNLAAALNDASTDNWPDKLRQAIVGAQTKLQQLGLAAPLPASLSVLEKVYQQLKDLQAATSTNGVTFSNGADVRTFLTDIVLKVDLGRKELRELMLGLAFELTDVKIFNIQVRRAGIRMAVLKSP